MRGVARGKRRKEEEVATREVSKERVWCLSPFFHSPRILETLNRLNLFPFSPCQSTILKKRIPGRRNRENFLSGSFVTRSLLYIHEGFAVRVRVREEKRRGKKKKHRLGVLTTDTDRSSYERVREGNLFSNRIRYGLTRGGSFQYPSKEWDDCNDVRTGWF